MFPVGGGGMEPRDSPLAAAAVAVAVAVAVAAAALCRRRRGRCTETLKTSRSPTRRALSVGTLHRWHTRLILIFISYTLFLFSYIRTLIVLVFFFLYIIE